EERNAAGRGSPPGRRAVPCGGPAAPRPGPRAPSPGVGGPPRPAPGGRDPLPVQLPTVGSRTPPGPGVQGRGRWLRVDAVLGRLPDGCLGGTVARDHLP